MTSAIRRMLETPLHAEIPPDRTWAAIADRILDSLLEAS
jgi:hypothetical protein